MAPDVPTSPTPAPRTPRPWSVPRLAELPKLTQLTLASAIGGGGGTGGGGSTVFGILLALLTLAGCSANDSTEPTRPQMPAAVMAVTCTAKVSVGVVYCGGPLADPPSNPDEILGGQGVRVVLRSRNVTYIGTDFAFEVQVQNVGAQSIGTDGTSATGVRAFFESDPVVTSGTGTITNGADSSGTFTAASQPYYVYPDSLPARDTTAWVPWHFVIDDANTTFTFEVLISAQVPDYGGLLRWSPVNALSTYQYNDLAWSGGNNALAVGYAGHAKRWNGTTWTTMNTGTTNDLYGVAAISQGEYLAVGDSGKVFKVSKGTWTLVYQSPSLFVLHAAWARDPNHWYAVGEQGLIVQYDAGTWSESIAGGVDFTMVSGTPSGSYVSAADITGQFYVSTGGGPWVDAGPIPGGGYVGAIAWDAAENFYFSTTDFGDLTGRIVRAGVTVDTISVLPAALTLDLFLFNDDSLIGSTYDFMTDQTSELKFRYGDVAPSVDTVSPPAPGPLFVTAKLDAAGTKFAAICTCEDIVTTDGSTWEELEDLDLGTFGASWGRGDSVWVTEPSGELWKIVDGTATLLTGVYGASGIAGFSGDSIFILADSTLWVGNGVDPWQEVTHLAYLGAGQEAFFHSIWGDTASHTLIVTGENGRIMQRVGGLWSELPPAGLNVSGVWGCSATQAWIVSGNVQILNWTPGSVTQDPTYTGAMPLAAATGTGCNDAWAGGPNSALFHWDGIAWNEVTVAGDDIFISALAPRSEGAVYVAGEDSKVASVSAAGVTSRMTVRNQGEDIYTIWRLDNGDLVVGSESKVVIGSR